jgi:hypothetical protein
MPTGKLANTEALDGGYGPEILARKNGNLFLKAHLPEKLLNACFGHVVSSACGQALFWYMVL